jgi:hypothetical protein
MNRGTEHVIVVDMWKMRECCVKESGSRGTTRASRASRCSLSRFRCLVYCQLSMERWWSSAFVTDVLRLRRSAQVRLQAFFAVSFSSNFLSRPVLFEVQSCAWLYCLWLSVPLTNVCNAVIFSPSFLFFFFFTFAELHTGEPLLYGRFFYVLVRTG